MTDHPVDIHARVEVATDIGVCYTKDAQVRKPRRSGCPPLFLV